MSCGCNENTKMTLKEELEVNDIQQIRKLIRHELQEYSLIYIVRKNNGKAR